jgi:hypothetical protein
MEKLKIFGYLFMAMLSCFTIGLYASSTVKYNEPVELHRWVITAFFGLMFLVLFLQDYRKK